MTPGGRVRVVARISDPRPLAIGEEGTVTRVRNAGTELEQTTVQWDSGRTLMLLPEDADAIEEL